MPAITLIACLTHVMILTALLRRTATYGETALLIGLDKSMGGMRRLMRLMEATMDQDRTLGRPYLTSLLVSQSGVIGRGFWGYLEKHGVVIPEADQARYLSDMRAQVYAHYSA